MVYVYYLYYITIRDMNQTITILEALVIGVATVLVYTFVKTVYEHYFKSIK